ncbi:MAG: DNA polymerase III subunit alpha, partial [Planctomycetia bacterium]
EQAQYAHPVMREVLEETYGVMVYQEQVMRILNRLGGIPLADAYKCIKAISKKNMEVIAKNRAQFVQGAVAQGMDAAAAEDVFHKIEFFAGYGFNKSHSTAYALLAYQTAYLKAHYPAEFMAALMSSEVDKTALMVEHIDDCKRMGLTVLPPDVNESDVEFTVVDGRVRFGMTAVKGVGEKAVASIVAERQARGAYKSLFDFCERTDVAVVPKSCIEALIKTGAFDGFGFKRSQLSAALPTALQSGAMTRDARNSGQGLLFDAPDGDGGQAQAVVMPNLAEWSDQEKLGYEKQLLGLYLSSHPLAEHQQQLRLYRSHEVAELKELPDQTEVIVGGVVAAVRLMTQKNGRNANQRYARFAFEDLTGSISSVMFADTYVEQGAELKEDRICFLRADVDKSREEAGLIVRTVIPLEAAPKELSGAMLVKMRADRHPPDQIDALQRLLKTRPGGSPVFLEVVTEDNLRIRLRLGDDVKVQCDPEFAGQVEGLLGAGMVAVVPHRRPAESNGNRGNGPGPGKYAGARKGG